MNGQQTSEIVKALAYGESPEQAAAADGVAVAEVQRIVAADAAEIQAEREILQRAGYLRISSRIPHKVHAVAGEPWIDVSAHQGTIDWSRVKAAGTKGAVIRAGYGNDASQQDKQFVANIKGATAAGLKVAIYWFSYAVSVDDAKREWATCRKIILPYRTKILFVAFDYEYDSFNYFGRIYGRNPTNELINSMAVTFQAAAKTDGWKTCIYTNNDYRKNHFTAQALATFDFVWLADYSGGPDISCTLQQTGSTGTVSGVSGHVDIDTAFEVFPSPNSTKQVDAFYRVRIGDRWLPEVRDLTDFAGLPGKAITDIAVRVSAGSVKYRVHVKGGAWLPYVTGCNINDRRSGYAGDGRPIDAVEIYYYTPADIRPVKRAKYRVAPVGGGYWPWQYDNDNTGAMDGYAGSFGRLIDHLQICIE